jgi:tetratricopeptide (TPR) repeat protein
MLAASGEAAAIRERHGRWFRYLAEAAAPHLPGTEQRRWLDRLEVEHDNLRAAIDHAVERGDGETAVRLGFACWRFWQQRGYLNEARMRLGAIEAVAGDLPAPLLGKLHEAAGGVAYWQADPATAAAHYDRALTIWRAVGDRREIANALYNRGFVDTVDAVTEGAARTTPGQFDSARGQLEEALAIYRDLGDPVGEANLLWALGGVAYFTNALPEAIERFRAALDGFRAVGQRTMEAWSLHMLGSALLKSGSAEEARTTLRHALRHFHEAGDLAGVNLCLDDLAAQAVVDGDLPRAGRLRGAARKLEATTGVRLAGWVEETFEAASRPAAQLALDPAVLERYATEGAAMPLDDVVAYALGGPGPGAAEAPLGPGRAPAPGGP